MQNNRRTTFIIAGLAIFKLCLHLFTNNNYELHRDALLYYSLGEHLDWGYMSVPPFIALVSKFSTLLFGNTTFALRFFPAVIGSVSVIIIARIIKEMKGGTMAIIIAALAFILSPAFLRSNTLFQPVSFNQFFWLLSGYLIVKLISTRDPKFWLWIFIVWGVGFLNKYSIAFFIVSSLVALMLTEHRNLFKSKYFFIGGSIGMLIILPNLIWQYSYNWPLIHHMKELQKYQFANVSVAGYIIDQFIMNFPGLNVWMTGLIVFLFYKAEKKFRMLTYTYFFTVLIILFLRGKPYYTLGLYPILFALGGYAIERYYKSIWKYITIALIFLFSIPMLPLSIPILSHEKIAEYTKPTAEFTNRWEDGKIYNLPQDYADMTGWKELSSIVIDHYNSLSQKEKDNCFIYAGNYGQAGAIFFYGKKYGLPEPISFNDNFALWAPDTIGQYSLFYIEHDISDLEILYDSIQKIGQVNDQYFRENGLEVYYCTHPKDTLQQFYAKDISTIKSRFRK
jgi:hypothetical protein